MCRASTDQGGKRRCDRTAATCAHERAASARYYQRGKARRKIAELADAGIPAVGDEDMPTTYHQHTPGQPVTLDSARKLTNPGRSTPPDKPEGALWASPGRGDADGSVKTAWTDWAARENFGEGGQLAELAPQPGAVVVTVQSRADAEALMGKYNTDRDGTRSFDWEAMKADGIDGVHVSDRMADVYASSTSERDGAAGNLEGWSAGSVAWLSSERLDVGESHQPGTYTPGKEDSEGSQAYLEPDRPDTEGAWDRVPKRFRPEPPEQPEQSDAPFTGPVGESSPLPERPSTSGEQKGGKGIRTEGLFEMSQVVLKAMRRKKKGKKKKAKTAGRR